MNFAAILLLLAYPAPWRFVQGDPPLICQAAGTVCLLRMGRAVVVLDGAQSATVLHAAQAELAWNEATLRAADWLGLQSDRDGRRDDTR